MEGIIKYECYILSALIGIYMELFLLPRDPLNPALTPESLSASLRASRKHYCELLLEKMRAPDGSYEEGFTLPGSSTNPRREATRPGNLDKNNPLSLHVEVCEQLTSPVHLSNAGIESLGRMVCCCRAQKDDPPGCRTHVREHELSCSLRVRVYSTTSRSFPEIDFFRHPEVQAQLTNILFLYSVINPSVGYRQGEL